MVSANAPHARPFLPFSDVERLLRDIVDAIRMIENFTAGMDLDEFREGPKTPWSASCR